MVDSIASRSKTVKPKAPRPRKLERNRIFSPPLTMSHPDLLVNGSDDNFRQLIYLFVEVIGRFSTCREAFGRAIGLTGSQFAVLIGVAYRQSDQGVTIKRLSEYVHLASTHVTTEVGRLSRVGLLSKRAGSDDRRSVLVSLTSKGEAAVLTVAPFVRRVNDLLFARITPSEIVAAQSMFNKLARNVEFAIAELRIVERDNDPARTGRPGILRPRAERLPRTSSSAK